MTLFNVCKKLHKEKTIFLFNNQNMTTKGENTKKVTKEEKREKFENRFTTQFASNQLEKLFLEDIVAYKKQLEDLQYEDVSSKWLTLKGFLKRFHSLSNPALYNKFELALPKSIQFLKDHVFPSNSKGFVYILSSDVNGQVFPLERTTVEWSIKLKKCPEIIAFWFNNVFDSEHQITIDLKRETVFEQGGIKCLNIFRGYRYDTFKKDITLLTKRANDIQFIWDHLRNCWCSGDEIYFDFIKHWICTLLCGRRKLKAAIYVKGLQGIGKGAVVRLLMRILGKNNRVIINKEKEAIGDFNGHIFGKTLAVVDDVKFSDSGFVDFGEKMKTNVTEDEISVRDLFRTAETLPNFTSWIILGNVDTGNLSERAEGRHRYCILHMLNKLLSPAYYGRLTTLVDEDDEFMEAFWLSCRSFYDPNWNEQNELKKLPLNETREITVLKSMPQIARFFKAIVMKPDLEKPKKRKVFYDNFCDWHIKVYQKATKMINHEFQKEIKNMSFVTFTQARINNVPTKDTVNINREKLLSEYRRLGYIVETDDIEDTTEETEVISSSLKDAGPIYKTDNNDNSNLRDEIAMLKKQISELVQTKQTSVPTAPENIIQKTVPKVINLFKKTIKTNKTDETKPKETIAPVVKKTVTKVQTKKKTVKYDSDDDDHPHMIDATPQRITSNIIRDEDKKIRMFI
jgi:hypothetical protein